MAPRICSVGHDKTVAGVAALVLFFPLSQHGTNEQFDAALLLSGEDATLNGIPLQIPTMQIDARALSIVRISSSAA